ncbi:hypothetical protein [Parafilimonas terrae]|uniref:Lipocalin-like domain-containing protein n=1 Tax=Parafilimonas terrae TaxID=1465490 RepID=A0A1I5WMQ0_9BACT|nr:hypothetical protein [Parafilimonas terrae]SFQ20851.1 hypothetical protein SAMN05444277_106281 [Parafilimonas terrae]
MIKLKKPALLLAGCFICFADNAQSLNWLLGTWNGSSSVNKTELVRTIIIDSTDGNSFFGIRTNEIKGRHNIKVETALIGSVDGETIVIKNGAVLYRKNPPNGEWSDCSNCNSENNITIENSRLVLTTRISGCKKECNGVTVYHKSICDFDSATQQYLITRFGDGADDLSACKEKTPADIAAEKKYNDSVAAANNIVRQNEEQRIKDSTIAAIAFVKKRRKEIADSINLAKKHDKQMQDSITAANNIARQKKTQHINDSIAKASIPKAPLPVKDSASPTTAKALETRDNVLLNTYHITTPDILLELFDNAQIDGDRVSVYHNGALIVNNQTLLKEPITIKIHADAANPMHEFTMIAENLGKIAPNTALMRVTVGEKVYKLSVKTDMQTNAKIVFYYDGK